MKAGYFVNKRSQSDECTLTVASHLKQDHTTETTVLAPLASTKFTLSVPVGYLKQCTWTHSLTHSMLNVKWLLFSRYLYLKQHSLSIAGLENWTRHGQLSGADAKANEAAPPHPLLDPSWSWLDASECSSIEGPVWTLPLIIRISTQGFIFYCRQKEQPSVQWITFMSLGERTCLIIRNKTDCLAFSSKRS